MIIPETTASPTIDGLLRRAQTEDATGYTRAQSIGAARVALLDGATYALAAKAARPNPGAPVVITIHGHGVHAHAGINAWAAQLRAGTIAGVISIQWWTGTGQAAGDYLTPGTLAYALTELRDVCGLEVVIVHGFSRGATQIPAMAQIATEARIDVTRWIVDSGGFSHDYPPNADLVVALDTGDEPLAGHRIVVTSGAAATSVTRATMETTRDDLLRLGADVKWVTDAAHPALRAADAHGFFVRSGEVTGAIGWLMR